MLVTPRHLRLPLAAALVPMLFVACADGDADVPAPVDTPPAAVSPDPAAPSDTPSPSDTAAPALDDLRLAYEVVAAGFRSPVFVGPLAGADDLLVVEQAGRIHRVPPAGERTLWLDLSSRVGSGANEQGLLGLALHPGFPATPRVYVHYTDTEGDTSLDVLELGTDGRPDPATRRTLLSVDQPATNHNGGMLAFGPDGMLYLALGDGGAANDRFGNGQDRRTLLGTILRLDVDRGDDGYEAPPDNPFADGEEGDDRVWIYGLRNPWRFAFDGDRVYVGDVGQGSFEEISTVAVPGGGGSNLGWPITEGPACFQPPTGCDRTGLTEPIITYPTREQGTCSVVQGPAYRGSAIPTLDGHVFYADFCAGFLRSFRLGANEQATAQRDWTAQVGAIEGVTSLGVDHDGELLVLARDGRVLRLVPVA